MKPRAVILLGLAAAVLILAISWVLYLQYLQDKPFFVELRRPSNVPKDAVFVPMVKGIWWEHCVYNPQGDFDHCEVWNEGGGVISDGVYLPYDGGPAAKADQLKIWKNSVSGLNDDAICLQNGRILLPKWLVEREKEISPDFFGLNLRCSERPGSQ